MNPEKRKYTGAPSMTTREKIVLAGLCASSLGLGACQPVSPEGVQETRSGTICDSYSTNMSAELLGPITNEAGVVNNVVHLKVTADTLCKSLITRNVLEEGPDLPTGDVYEDFSGVQVAIGVSSNDSANQCFFPANQKGDDPQGVVASFSPDNGTSRPSTFFHDEKARSDVQRALGDPKGQISVCIVWQDSEGNYHKVPGTERSVYNED